MSITDWSGPVDYFEQLIPTLTPEDVEDISKYPDSFKAFMEMK